MVVHIETADIWLIKKHNLKNKSLLLNPLLRFKHKICLLQMQKMRIFSKLEQTWGINMLFLKSRLIK